MTLQSTRVLVLCGTRPEAIKLAPLIRRLRKDPAFDLGVCVTGQHRSMLDQVFAAFDLTPDFDLDVMRPDQRLPDLTARVMTGASGVIESFRPQWVVVQGDTTTAFAGALAGFYAHASVAHVEAGLRTGCARSPFPEELNRRMAGCIADLHFAPTDSARVNLLRENYCADRIFVTGNTVIDALYHVVEQIESDRALRMEFDRRFSFLDSSRRLVLVTGHRRESFGEPFRDMCNAFVDLLASTPDIEILYPVHLNPNVQAPVNEILRSAPPHLASRIHLAPPVDYLAFVYLLRRADLVITDSGGVQEEAPALGKPVLVTRENTERPEAVEAGCAHLVGTSRARIVAMARRLLADADAGPAARIRRSPYGDGVASERIAERLREFSGGPKARLPQFRFLRETGSALRADPVM